MNCEYCRAEMKPMFTGYYCPNHCDLPADKKAAAKKKDEEIASAKPNPTAGSVATPVSTPVIANCIGLCGKPPNYANDGWGNYYCCNLIGSTTSVCRAQKPANLFTTTAANYWNITGFPTFTINWGGHAVNVISDPDCPADKPYFHTRDIAFVSPVLIQRNGVVPGPKVRADSSPPGKDWRADYPESHSRSYNRHVDWD